MENPYSMTMKEQFTTFMGTENEWEQQQKKALDEKATPATPHEILEFERDGLNEMIYEFVSRNNLENKFAEFLREIKVEQGNGNRYYGDIDYMLLDYTDDSDEELTESDIKIKEAERWIQEQISKETATEVKQTQSKIEYVKVVEHGNDFYIIHLVNELNEEIHMQDVEGSYWATMVARNKYAKYLNVPVILQSENGKIVTIFEGGTHNE